MPKPPACLQLPSPGLLTSLVSLQPCKLAAQDEARFLVFDGDVDPVWVENLNSVMDDNRLLTLPNGERIRLQPHCRLLFEVRWPCGPLQPPVGSCSSSPCATGRLVREQSALKYI